jgi:hypothetical protein
MISSLFWLGFSAPLGFAVRIRAEPQGAKVFEGTNS